MGHIVAAVFSAGLKILVGFTLMLSARREHRKVGLLWGLAWISYALAILGDISGAPMITALSSAFFVSFMILGSAALPWLEISQETVAVISTLPPTFASYLVLLHWLTSSPP